MKYIGIFDPLGPFWDNDGNLPNSFSIKFHAYTSYYRSTFSKMTATPPGFLARRSYRLDWVISDNLINEIFLWEVFFQCVVNN